MIQLKHEGSGKVFYATQFSAGFDICAQENAVILPQQWKLIKTGLRIIECQGAQYLNINNEKILCLPEIQIRPRSGLAAKYGITVLNSPSTIDCDYRGEIIVNLINHSQEPFSIALGDRIAQGVCALVLQIPGIEVVDKERGLGGFGSTGV